jgi:hypothetical protein
MSTTHPQEQKQEACVHVPIQPQAVTQTGEEQVASASRPTPLDGKMVELIVKWFNVDHAYATAGPDCHLFTASGGTRTIPAWLTTLPLVEDTSAGRNRNRGHHIGRTVQNFHQYNRDGTIPVYNKYPGFQWERVINSRNEFSLIDDIPDLKLLAQLVETVFNIPKESVHSIVTKYFADGAIHKHQDGPQTLHPSSFIVAFSYGFDTEMAFVPLPEFSDTYSPFTIVIPHGSVFLLGAETNRAYTHCIQPNNRAVVRSAVECPHRFSVIFRHCTNLVTFSDVYTTMMNSRKKKELARISTVCRYIAAPVPATTPMDEKVDQNTEVMAPCPASPSVDATRAVKPKKRKSKNIRQPASETDTPRKKCPRTHPKNPTAMNTAQLLRAKRTKEHGDCLYTEMRERSDLVVREDPTGLFRGIHKARQGAVGGGKHDENMEWLSCDEKMSSMVLLVDFKATTGRECDCIHERITIRFGAVCHKDGNEDNEFDVHECWEVVESVPHGVYQVGSMLTTNFQEDCFFMLNEADVVALFCKPAVYEEKEDARGFLLIE